MSLNNHILCGDARDMLSSLPARSVQCCVTSPPYWGLRDYGVEGQIGLEDSPSAYIAALMPVFDQIWRVLRDDGTLWLNLGDTYIGYHGNKKAHGAAPSDKPGYREGMRSTSVGADGLKNKDLAGIPWRVAFALQDAGWYLRCDCIWAKPNPMPESVRQAMSSKWEKGTSGPAGDEHHNLVGCMAFAQNSRNEVRLQGGDGQISGALAADDGMKQRTYVAIPRNSGDAFSTSGNGTWREGIGPLRARGQDSHENLCLAFTERGRAEGRTLEYLEEQAYCLMNPGSGGRTHSRQIMTPQLQVRRLTPHECERLQGFPDDYTAVPYRIRNRFVSGGILPKRIVLRSYRRYLRRMARQCKEPLSFADTLKCADGPRYKAIGNSMAVNVMRWIGERVEKAVRAKELPHA